MGHITSISGPLIVAAEPDLSDREDLREWRRRIETAIGALRIQAQFGQRLSRDYAELLTKVAR